MPTSSTPRSRPGPPTTGLRLYPHQEEALLEIATGANVILSTPTGSGKSLVAIGAHAVALAGDRRTFYTAPIKALVSEKFFALCDVFGPVNVGMMTGDARVNAEAPIICATAEILANIALRDGADADVDQVVMDEFHFYADPDRGWAWQVPLIELPQAQFVLMSATLGDVTPVRAGSHPAHRPADRVDPQHRATGPAELLVLAQPAAPRSSTSCCRPSGTDLRRALHAGGGAGAGAGTDERERRDPGREGRDRRGHRQLPVHVRLRQGAVPTGTPRDRRPPRRHAAALPPAGRDARPGRPAQGHLRYGHPRRRHQRADPDRTVHVAVEVRRHEDAAAPGSRVPPDRRARRAGRLRHRRYGRRTGARARDREREGAREGRRRRAQAPQGGAQEAAGGHGLVGSADLRAARARPSRSRSSRASASPTRCCST